MKFLKKYQALLIVLLLAGYGVALQGCGKNDEEPQDEDTENLLTHQSDSLVRILSESGRKSYRFETPLMERYELAKEPYSEFRKGVKVETFQDSTENVEGTLIADYAIFFEKLKLWEAKGNVVVINAEGHILETQQLFWNQRTKKIYTNIDSKITQGEDVLYGIGFESDEKMEVWEFRRPRGRLSVDIEPTQDTTRVREETAVVQEEPKRPDTKHPTKREVEYVDDGLPVLIIHDTTAKGETLRKRRN